MNKPQNNKNQRRVKQNFGAAHSNYKLLIFWHTGGSLALFSRDYRSGNSSKPHPTIGFERLIKYAQTKIQHIKNFQIYDRRPVAIEPELVKYANGNYIKLTTPR